MKRTFLDTVWYQCLVLTTQFRKGAWQEIDLNHAHHTCELKSISFWTIDLVKRELNIFHTESSTDFQKNVNDELFCPKFSVKSCAQINRFERSSIYSYLQRDLHSWTERKCHNNVKLFVEYSKKEAFDTEKKRQDMITIMYLKANTGKYAADIWPKLSKNNHWRKRTNQKYS